LRAGSKTRATSEKRLFGLRKGSTRRSEQAERRNTNAGTEKKMVKRLPVIRIRKACCLLQQKKRDENGGSKSKPLLEKTGKTTGKTADVTSAKVQKKNGDTAPSPKTARFREKRTPHFRTRKTTGNWPNVEKEKTPQRKSRYSGQYTGKREKNSTKPRLVNLKITAVSQKLKTGPEISRTQEFLKRKTCSGDLERGKRLR